MLDKHLEVLVPTLGRPGLKDTISSILQQIPKESRINVLADGSSASTKMLLSGFIDPRIRILGVPNGPRGNVGHCAVRWAIETISDLHGWMHVVGDDDLVLPGAYKALLGAVDEICGMVLGIVKGVSKAHPGQLVKWLGANEIRADEVTGNCGIYSLAHMQQLESPIYQDTTYASDWKLIERMMHKFPYKRVSALVVLFPMTGL